MVCQIEKEWSSVSEVAEYLGVAPQTVYNAIKVGDLGAHGYGQGDQGGYRIHRDDLQDYINRCRKSPKNPRREPRQPTRPQPGLRHLRG